MDSPYRNYLVIDTETGGLPKGDKKAVYDYALTEIAVVAVSQQLEIIDQTSWLIKPYKEDLLYEKKAEEVSGISQQMCINEGLDASEVHKYFLAMLKKHKVGSQLPVIVMHNMRFDIPFLMNFFEFMKDDLTKYVKPEPEDTLKWARMCWPVSTNYKLGTCCENANITLQDAHRALTDTIATAKLWIYFQKNLRGVGQTSITKETPRFRDTFEL